MKSLIRVLASCCVLVLCCSPVRAEETPSLFPTIPTLTTLEQWDVLAEQLRKGVWAVPPTAATLPPDARGRVIPTYVNEWLLTRDAEARLIALRERAQKQADSGDQSGLAASLNEGGLLMYTEAYRTTIVIGYAITRLAAVEHRSLIDQWVQRSGVEQMASARVDPLMLQLADLTWSAMTAPLNDREAMLRSYWDLTRDIFNAYNEERVRLSDIMGARDYSNPDRIYTRARTTPCPPPVAGTSGKDEPKAGAVADLEKFYPDVSRNTYIEGRVKLLLVISHTGCMERGYVLGSSGVKELDQAALRWAEESSFLPAERNQQAVAGSMRLAVAFRLYD